MEILIVGQEEDDVDWRCGCGGLGTPLILIVNVLLMLMLMLIFQRRLSTRSLDRWNDWDLKEDDEDEDEDEVVIKHPGAFC